ncbi:melanocortin-2 receptor accessory protein 2A-like [Osmerus eperlanus]|uniref:melanocortin-2 receptor accessory protein 2A-like n=1 Tax=Osmerus eperlanus TaxID=29151 RepID=UPI002E119494
MSEFRNQSRATARGSDYVWQYEYYDDDEPVSFEGLKAHRYSIVIGFWVGLAVFVIFMFFILTLLTKTGAPHQENLEPCEKRHRLGTCVVDINCPQDTSDKALSRPLLEESRSFFHFYISEEEQQGWGHGAVVGQAERPRGRLAVLSTCGIEEDDEEELAMTGEDAAGLCLRGLPKDGKGDGGKDFLSHFNIPNFVNSEHSSTLGDDDLLLCEPPIILDSQSQTQDARHIIR